MIDFDYERELLRLSTNCRDKRGFLGPYCWHCHDKHLGITCPTKTLKEINDQYFERLKS